jgi:glycosyltransferase involved in cell wall biosynthesis
MNATDFPPAGLASIVVTYHNQWTFTRSCISALVKRTRAPWELIAVDNGSTDSTGAYLAGLQDIGSIPVTIIANSDQRSFSAVCQQGLKVARGAYVVFLNSDAVVTDTWLDRLIALAEADPKVGMTGCMSNDASRPQLVETIPYADPESMQRFAARWHSEHRGQWLTVAALSGPCVLIKRRVLEMVGVPGEGNGSDLLGTDLPRRLAENGFTARVAHDLFIHRGEFRSPPPRVQAAVTKIERIDVDDFTRQYGAPDLARALRGYTLATDTRVVLTLLTHAGARRVLEIGTAFGDMTANLTEWTGDDARIFSLGIVRGMEAAGIPEQDYEAPEQAEFGRSADHFGKVHKVSFITADSRDFDFGRLAPLDFVFLDGGHDYEHVTSDTRGAYAALAPGGYLVWHDFASTLPWIKVREAVEQLGLREIVAHVAGSGVAFLRKCEPRSNVKVDPGSSQPLRLVWEGDQRGRHSLGLINRMLCHALLDRGHDLGLDSGEPMSGTAALRLDPQIEARLGDRPTTGSAQAHVRHRWPPVLDPPSEGRWIFMQPWEFGSLPRTWLPALRRADEFWAYSQAVRHCYLDAGVPADRVHIIPLGVDPTVFRLGVEPYALPLSRSLRFLFVGGTIWRKGFDILLNAYAAAFSTADDVCLVVQDFGTDSFYRGQTAGSMIEAIRSKPGAPAILYLNRALDWTELAGLYSACDCLVHPYRGEGFALPVIEAMACGLPVIVTGAGPALDYAGEGTAYLVAARRSELPNNRVGDIETIARPWVWEPDRASLVEQLRRVASHREEARAKGLAASAWIHGRFTWEQSADAVEARLWALTQGR